METRDLIEVIGSIFYRGSIIWPVIILCSVFAASFVASFTPAKKWLGKIARGAFLLWLISVCITLYQLYQSGELIYIFQIDFGTWYDFQSIFYSGLLWTSIGIGLGLLFVKIGHDLCQYYQVLTKEAISLYRRIKK